MPCRSGIGLLTFKSGTTTDFGGGDGIGFGPSGRVRLAGPSESSKSSKTISTRICLRAVVPASLRRLTTMGSRLQSCCSPFSKATHCPCGIRRIEIQRLQRWQRRRTELAMQPGLAEERARHDTRLTGRFQIANNQIGGRSGESHVEKPALVLDRCSLVRD